MKIVIYTSQTCSYCKELKKWLIQRGITFLEKNTALKEHRIEFKALQGFGLPFTVLTFEDGTTQKINGFNEKAFEKIFLK